MKEQETYHKLIDEVQALRKELEILKKEHTQKCLTIENLKLHEHHSPLIIINCNLELKVTAWNRAAENLFSFSKDEVENKYLTDLICPGSEDREKLQESFNKVILRKGGIKNHAINITKEKKKVYCDWYISPVFNGDNEILSFKSVVLDITDNITTKQALIESKERFKTLSEASFEGIYILKKGICIEANQAGCKLFGYRYEEIIGLNALLVICEQDRETVSHNIATGYPKPYAVKGLRKDGTTFYAEIQGRSYSFKGEEVRITSIRNIEQRKKTELEIKKSEEKFKSIFEHAGDGILIINNQGDIIDINESFCSISRYKVEDILQKHISSLFSKETLQKLPLRFDLVNEGKTIIRQRDIIGPGGYSIPIEMSSKRLDKNYLIASFRDLTKRKKVENAIRESNRLLKTAKEKAEISDRLKSKFLANMSHEIRTPMNGIVGFSNLLNESDLDPRTRQNYTNIIISSCKQLKRIIDDILEISELETRQVKVINSKICINHLLVELLSLFNNFAKENKVPLFIKKQLSDRNSTVYTDEIKLRKILNNLIENAFHYTTEGFVEVGYTLEENSTLKFYVTDTGIGIKPEMKQLIFERFTREDKQLSRRYGGLGLGLAIAKENSELLGGKIGVESEKDKGSTFYFTIPYKPVFEPQPEPLEIEAEEGEKKLTVLIVEDEEINYLYLETIIKRFNNDIELIHAKNGLEAVNECKKNKLIDLILMDIKMPVMGGLEATRQIREFNREIPIVAQTAYSRLEDQRKAENAGCNEFLSKPIDKDLILKTIRKYLTY